MDGTLTILAVLSGPSVSLTQPANSATFPAGAILTLLATAGDPQGTVTQVEFFQGGTNLLGVATNAPYSAVWSNVASGSYVLTAQATDSRGLGSTSAVVDIVVTNPLPPALAVSIVSPAALSSFCQGNDVLLNALVTNAVGSAQVEFFIGGATPLGTVGGSSPYTFTWTAPVAGTYSLTALATDGHGSTAASTAVEVVVAQPGQCGQVAIVRAIADPEIDALQNYLFTDMQLSSQVYDQEGLSPQALDGFELVIWDGLGTSTNRLASGTVAALYAAYTNGKPLYLIGERLASAGTTLPEPEQSEWTALTRLSAPSAVGGDGKVAVQSSIASNPILDGMFGVVTNFAYPPRLDIASNLDTNTEVLGTSGSADVLLVYPGFQANDTGQTRIFTQDVRVSPPDAPGSTGVLRSLFENTVYWLLGAGWCVNVDVGLSLTGGAANQVQVGQLLEYDLQVIRDGECPATGVVVTNVLPAGVQFVSAQSAQGTWGYDPVARQVTFFLGYVLSNPSLSITVMPVASGTLANTLGVLLNQQYLNPSKQLLTITTQVLPGPSLLPALGIQLTPPAAYELRLTGAANVRYDLQASADLIHWITMTNALGPDWQTALGLAGTAGNSRRFYRATVAK